MADKVTKKYNVSVSGVLSIQDDDILIEVEDRGEFRLSRLIEDFDGRQVKISVNYDEEVVEPDDELEIDENTGEVIE